MTKKQEILVRKLIREQLKKQLNEKAEKDIISMIEKAMEKMTKKYYEIIIKKPKFRNNELILPKVYGHYDLHQTIKQLTNLYGDYLEYSESDDNFYETELIKTIKEIEAISKASNSL